MSQYPAGSYETQFESHSDDEENLYSVERILAEKGGKYLVQWEGIDPTTGEKWAPDWVPKTDCTDDLIADWKLEKAKMKQKQRVMSVRSASSVSRSLDAPPQPSKSRSVSSSKSVASRTTETSTSTRSRSPAPLPKPATTKSRRQSSFYIEIPAPRRTKRRRDSDTKPEPISPVKRMRLGGPASPLPASPFDDDDGVGAMFPKKRSGPVTYSRKRKPAVVKSPSFPKLAGPYLREHNAPERSFSRGPAHPEPTKRKGDNTSRAEDDEGGVSTDTETEAESSTAAPPKAQAQRRHSPLKSKSEPLIKHRTRNTTRNVPSEPEKPRAASVPFERPHPTSAARTRDLPSRNRSAQREIKKQIVLGLPGPPDDYPWWPRVVEKDETLRRRSDTKSRTSSVANTSRKSAGEASVAGPSAPPKTKAAPAPEAKVSHPAPEAEEPRPATPPPAPTPPPASSNPSPEALPKRSSLAKSTAASSGRPSSAKSVLFRVEGVDDFDEYQADYPPVAPEDREAGQERIMSSVESENEPISRDPTQSEPERSQSQWNSDSSKNTHISDSQRGTKGKGKEDDNSENQPDNEAEGSETEVGNLGLAPPEPEEDEEQEVGSEGDREGDQEDDQDLDQEDKQEQEQEQEHEDEHDEIQDSEEVPMDSSPSLGGDIPELPLAPGVNTESLSRELSPLPDALLGEPFGHTGDTDGVDYVRDVEQTDGFEHSYEEADADVSMAHATEVDMLLSSDVSQQSESKGHEVEQTKGYSLPTPGDNVIAPAESTADAIQQEHCAEEPADSTQALTDSSSGHLPAPDSRAAIDHPTTREVISTLLPGILDTSSQSQSHSRSLPTDTQDYALIPPALPAQIIGDILAWPDSAPAPQGSQSKQENTHSSIEEPASSWNIPRAGQPPPQIDTISNFTLTNPGIELSPAVPSADSERSLLSSLPSGINGHDVAGVSTNQESPSQVNGSETPQETTCDHSSMPFPASSRSGELGAVPEMSVEVLKQYVRHVSPESDIGEFSPRESPSARSSPRSGGRASVQRYQQNAAHQSSPSPGGTWNNTRQSGRSSLQSGPLFQLNPGEDTTKQIQEQATRIQALLADLANLESAKKAIEAEASAFVESTTRLNEALQQERKVHVEEIEMQSATISDLQKQLEAARSQYETAESQREFALEQYTRASTEAKRISDENKVLEAKIEKLERQLSSGLHQWKIGFESNVVRHQQEIRTLEGQLAIEREMYTRSKAPELCRRAAEWYELKKQIKELEEDAAEAERREALLREREVEIRRRELAIADREQALEDSVRAMQFQAPMTQNLSQDDLQTETMLSDRSAILAGLNGDLGEEMVWMCSYRENTGKICGRVFETMGMLITHVLDAGGHKVEAACSCVEAS
ncbi:hypothetical protein OPQ81_007540 [Rhizoctonia solani]|nr:hypothetical protein OPQ81_007540 [Rhizoctonia solani]